MARKLREIFLYRCSGCLTVRAFDYKPSGDRGWCGACKTNAIFEAVAIDFVKKQFVTVDEA